MLKQNKANTMQSHHILDSFASFLESYSAKALLNLLSIRFTTSDYSKKSLKIHQN